MRRVYTSTAHFRAPFDTPNISFAGLGNSYPDEWPKGRSYWTVADYRAPYDNGYYQSGALRGLGAVADYKPVAYGIGATMLVGAAVGALSGKRGKRGAAAASGAIGGGLLGMIASGVTYAAGPRA